MKKYRITFFTLLVIVSMSLLHAAAPFLPTNYDEPYRGQYHFSQQSGWINDINGLWYYKGTYYLTYQTTPNSPNFDFAHCSIGMATSPDMMHWTQKSVIAEPTAAEGTPMSGSVVIDSINTSGLKTGTNPVFVAIYTSEKTGQCLLYSNDLGNTWLRYSGNPVINTGGTNPRDPHVFWFAPTSKWVMVLYHESNGGNTDIYNSTNLINWTKTSTVTNFGHECPDFIQLPVDGNQNNKKWALWAGDGGYLTGNFDGSIFTQDPGGWKLLDNNNSIFFYAAQTFNVASVPGNRVIQLGWQGNPGLMSSTNLVPEYASHTQWNQNATFPTELSFKTSAGVLRLCANPIPEISNIWASTQNWQTQTLTSSSNPLSLIQSKCFDITAEFDLTATTATQIKFLIANKTITYDITNHTLNGKVLNPISNILKIRILSDWSQYELFGNDGLFYWSERFAFDPVSTSLGLTANGNVTLNSMTFHNVSRTWTGVAAAYVAPTLIDDASASTIYNGIWVTDANSIYYNNTCHVSTSTNEYFQTTFTGTQVSWYGLKNSDLGMATIYIDGVLVQDDIDCYTNTPRCVYLLFSKTNLSNGSHTIKVVVKGTKNAASAGIALVHDYFSVVATAPTVAITGNLTFGNVKKSLSATKTFTITNTDTKALSVTSIDLPAGFSANWTSGNVTAAAHQDVIITFAPTDENAYTGFIKVNTSNGIFSIAVSATGISAFTKNTILPSNPNIRYMGRIDFTTPNKPLFAFPNVTIKAKFEGTSLDLLLKHYNGSDFTNNYFQSIVDGGTPVKFVVTSTQQTYPIAKNLTEGTHSVEITKVTESYNGECQFLGFQTDSLKSLVTPDPLPELKLEFFGNSITSGYGIEGGAQPSSDNSYKAYPAVAARELNAQFHTTSYSGIGVVKGYPSFLMSQMYNRTIAITSYSPFPSNNTWDFSKFIPDFVIVALGTNDYNLGYGSGSITAASFNTGYNSLITIIRTAYPRANIICTNSPMITDIKLGNSIHGDVTVFNMAGDINIHYFAFTHMEGGGFNGHPGVADGQTNGKELAVYIKSLMSSTSINELNINKSNFTVLPNPVRNSLNIQSIASINSIEITDISGKTLLNRYIGSTSSDVDMSNYSKGVFVLKATIANSEVIVRKVVKN